MPDLTIKTFILKFSDASAFIEIVLAPNRSADLLMALAALNLLFKHKFFEKTRLCVERWFREFF